VGGRRRGYEEEEEEEVGLGKEGRKRWWDLNVRVVVGLLV